MTDLYFSKLKKDDVLFLMEISHFLGHYFFDILYKRNLNVDRVSIIINTWAFELFNDIRDIDLNDLVQHPTKYHFSGQVWSFKDIIKEFGDKKLI